MIGLLVVLGAALGAPTRFLAAHFLDRRLPWGTLAVNVVGSGLLGLSLGLALGDRTWAFVGVGFCGALTSYSSFAVQAVDRPRATATTYVALTVVGSLLAVWAGWLLGRSL